MDQNGTAPLRRHCVTITCTEEQFAALVKDTLEKQLSASAILRLLIDAHYGLATERIVAGRPMGTRVQRGRSVA